MNAKGGVLGKKLKLIYEDNQSKSGESATIARQTHFARQSRRTAGRSGLRPLAGSRAHLPGKPHPDDFALLHQPQGDTRSGDYIFRVCFTDPFQGKLIANFALNTLKAKRVAVLTDVALAYSVGLAQLFQGAASRPAAARSWPSKITASGDKDFNAQLTAIKAANPDAIFVPGYYTEAGLIVAAGPRIGHHGADIRRRRLGGAGIDSASAATR